MKGGPTTQLATSLNMTEIILREIIQTTLALDCLSVGREDKNTSMFPFLFIHRFWLV